MVRWPFIDVGRYFLLRVDLHQERKQFPQILVPLGVVWHTRKFRDIVVSIDLQKIAPSERPLEGRQHTVLLIGVRVALDQTIRALAIVAICIILVFSRLGLH